MSLSMADFDRLRSHWAVEAIGSEGIDHATRLVHERLAQHAVGKQIAFSFTGNDNDTSFLERVALAYELAAIEGLDELSRPGGNSDALRNQAMAASSCSFDIRRLLPVPENTHDRLFFVLQLSSLAYCGDRWSDFEVDPEFRTGG